MADEKEFKYDPEEQDSKNKFLRLPFALCKAQGIAIQDWWTPKDAWRALKNGGYVSDVSEEYKKFAKELKKKQAQEYRQSERYKARKERQKTKEAQLKDPEQNPDYSYVHKDNFIAGQQRKAPMTFEQADSGAVNPNYKRATAFGNILSGKAPIGYVTNCQTCVATFFARRKGYDVKALPNLNNLYIARLSSDPGLAYIDENGKKPIRQKAVGGKIKYLESTVKEGEIHAVDWAWGNSRKGHIVICERDKAGVFLYDPQTNTTYRDKDISKFLSRAKDLASMNLTNCSLNEVFCDKIMKPAKGEQ